MDFQYAPESAFRDGGLLRHVKRFRESKARGVLRKIAFINCNSSDVCVATLSAGRLRKRTRFNITDV
jgi:hypothetical protein